MKKNIAIIALLFISFSSFSQSKLPESHNTVTITLTEEQLGKFYQLFKVAQPGLYETDMPGKQIKALSIFSDSCTSSWNIIYTKWHPAPKELPKTDSTGKK